MAGRFLIRHFSSEDSKRDILNADRLKMGADENRSPASADRFARCPTFPRTTAAGSPRRATSCCVRWPLFPVRITMCTVRGAACTNWSTHCTC